MVGGESPRWSAATAVVGATTAAGASPAAAVAFTAAPTAAVAVGAATTAVVGTTAVDGAVTGVVAIAVVGAVAASQTPSLLLAPHLCASALSSVCSNLSVKA